MANLVYEVLLTRQPLETPKAKLDRDSGAVVEFWGVVRELENGRVIEGIDYDAHSAMAEHQLQLIASEAAQKFDLGKVIIQHRIGFVRTGEPSLFLQAKAAHRGAAFDAGQWIVDELKKRVPIWKRPRFEAVTSHEPGSAIATAL